VTAAQSDPLDVGLLARALLEASPDAVVIVDPLGTIVTLNGTAGRLLGYDPDELVGTSIDLLVPSRQRADHAIARAAYGSRRRAMSARPDLLAVRKDGTTFTVQINLMPLDAEGRICAVLRDVTRLRRITSEAERWANVFEHIEIGVVVTDADEVIELCNPAFARMHGYRPGDLVGVAVTEVIAPESRPDLPAHQRMVDEKGHAVWETMHVRVDGSQFPVVVDSTAIRDDDGTFQYQATTIKDITTRRAASERLAHLASHDELTGLANRALLLAEAEQALTAADGDHHVAVLFCDLDDFKMVNDSIGHAAGDLLLVALAGRLVAALPAGAVASRPGGDEFVFLLGGLDGDREVAEEQARLIASRLLMAISAPIEIEGRRLHTTMSIGIALSDGDGATPAEMLRDSDTAMYRAKAAGRSSVDVFDDALRARTMRRVELESELRDAVARSELVVHYQPVVDIETGTILGAEALVRWEHPDHGMLLPDDFLDVAEAAGLMVEIGRRVLEDSARSVAAWRRSTGRDLYVSVNIAAAQLGIGRLAAEVTSLLTGYDLPTSALRLEVTENTLLASDGVAAQELATLVSGGTSIGLDDFGTGYGSLTHLMSSGASFLKLDRRFVHAIESPIAEAVIGLGNALDLEVIAEGIETRDEARRLLALGARLGQGFLYGRAVDSAELTRRLLADPEEPFERH